MACLPSRYESGFSKQSIISMILKQNAHFENCNNLNNEKFEPQTVLSRRKKLLWKLSGWKEDSELDDLTKDLMELLRQSRWNRRWKMGADEKLKGAEKTGKL